MYCKKCGTMLEDDANFCATCGTKIERISAQTSIAEKVISAENPTISHVSATSPKKNGKKVIIAVAVFFVVVVTAIAAVFIGGKFFVKNGNPDEQVIEELPGFVMYNTEQELYLKYTDSGYVQTLAKGADLGYNGEYSIARSSQWFSYYDSKSGYLFYPGRASGEDYSADIYRIKPDSQKAQAGETEPLKVASGVSFIGYTVCNKGEKVYYINSKDETLYCNENGVDTAICGDVEAIFICEESNNYLFAKRVSDSNGKLYKFDPVTYEYESLFTYKSDMDLESSLIKNEDLSILVYSDGSDVWALFNCEERKKVTSLSYEDTIANCYYNYVDGGEVTSPENCIYVTISKPVEIPAADMIEDDLGNAQEYNGTNTSMLRTLVRNNSFEEYVYEIYSIIDGEIALVSERAKTAVIDKDAVIYLERPEQRSYKLSQVVKVMKDKFSDSLESDINSCMRSAIYNLMNYTGNSLKIAINGVVNETGHELCGYGLYYDKKNELIYYSVEPEDYGDYTVESWYKCSIKDNRIETTENLGDDIFTLWVNEYGDYIYMKNVDFSNYSEACFGDLYMNGKFIDSNVCYLYHTYLSDIKVTDGILLYFKDFDDYNFTGTLRMYNGRESTDVAYGVSSHFAYDAENIYYIDTYDNNDVSGDIKHYDTSESHFVISSGYSIFIP